MGDRSLLVGYVDYVGRLRSRPLPGGQRERCLLVGRHVQPRQPQPRRAGGVAGAAGAGVDHRRVRRRRRGRDRAGVPVGGAVRLCFGRLTAIDGTPWPEACPRSALEGAVERLAAIGLHALVGFEPEGYLLDDRGAPEGNRHFSSPADLVELEPFLDEVIVRTAAAGIELEQCSKELGPNQFEVNLPPRDPLTAAEDLVLVQEAAGPPGRSADRRRSCPGSRPRCRAPVRTSTSACTTRRATPWARRPTTSPPPAGRRSPACSSTPADQLRRPAHGGLVPALVAGAWVPVVAGWSRTSRAPSSACSGSVRRCGWSTAEPTAAPTLTCCWPR